MLKEYNGVSCFDYGALAPYVEIDLVGDGVDVVFISPHKFIGGPQTPGVLVVKKVLVGVKPSVPAGGTVDFVTGW